MKKIYLFVFAVLISFNLKAQPANDDACNAIPLTIGEDCSATLPFDNTGATTQQREPVGECYGEGSIEQTVWFSFVAPSSGAVSIDTDFPDSGMQDSQITVFELQGGECDLLFNFVQIACNEDKLPDSEFTEFNAAIPPIKVNPGQTYYIQVDGYYADDGDPTTNDTDEGSFCIVVTEENPPLNDDCENADVYGGFGPNCTFIWGQTPGTNATTIGATAGNNIDVFSCDGSEFNATVYYTFNAGVPEVEFNLIRGENINVAVFTNIDRTACNNSAVQVTGNCFTDIDASALANPMNADVLFTNLTPQTSYLMAIWTNEGEATDFEFCLTRAPQYECGDGVCYDLAESYADCPNDCPCLSSVDLYSYITGKTTSVPEAVCPEIVGGITNPANPGLYIPFTINTEDTDLTDSSVSSDVGTLFTSTVPPTPLPNSEANTSLIYLFLTEDELNAGGTVTVTFTSDAGACTANITFDIADLIRPDTSECGGCNLNVVPDYANASCSGEFVLLNLALENAIGPYVWIGQDGNRTLDLGTDILIALDGSTNISFPNSDITLTVYDGGNPNCAINVTFTTGDFTCSINEPCMEPSGTIANVCRLDPVIDSQGVICNLDGNLIVPIDIGSSTGVVTFNPDVISGSGTTADPYNVSVDLNNCQPIDFTVSDESTCDEKPIVTINSPERIAGGINVSTNDDNWGIQIDYELGICGTNGAVTGTVAAIDDGNTAGGQLTDFCEPVPPELPDAGVCAQISGQIALIDRGQCNFTQKVENAQNCGAIGVIVCNCQPGPGWCSADEDVLITMGIGILTDTITIPAVFMRYADCQEIKAELNKDNEVEICIGAPVSIRGCSREFTVDVCDDYPADFCENAPAVQGCIDANACNYNSSANVDDRSCFYTGDACIDGDTNTVDDIITEYCVCRGRITTCSTSIDEISPPTQSTLCNEGSNLPTFSLPASSLPDVVIVLEVNGTIVDISTDGIFDASGLMNINDEVCFTVLSFDVAAVQNLLDIAIQLCPLVGFPLYPGASDPCPTIFEFVDGRNDGDPGINNVEEALTFFAVLGNNTSINSVDEAIATVNGLNETIQPLGFDEICYAVSNAVCLPVINCSTYGLPKTGKFNCD